MSVKLLKKKSKGVGGRHCKVNKHMHRLVLSESATCRPCGGEDETPKIPIHLMG